MLRLRPQSEELNNLADQNHSDGDERKPEERIDFASDEIPKNPGLLFGDTVLGRFRSEKNFEMSSAVAFRAHFLIGGKESELNCKNFSAFFFFHFLSRQPAAAIMAIVLPTLREVNLLRPGVC